MCSPSTEAPELEARILALEQALDEANRALDRLQSSSAATSDDEIHFKELFDRTPFGYQSLDENGNFLEVNEAWLNILGYSRHEVVGRNFADFLVPEYHERFAINFPRFKAAGAICDAEFELLKKDGTAILVSFTGRIGYHADGSFKRTHCMFRDITESTRAKAALKASEGRFRALFEQMPSGVAVYEAVDNGTDFVFKDFNPAGERIDGIRRDEIIGKRVTQAFPGVREFGLFRVFQRVWKTGDAEYFPDAVYADGRLVESWRENWVYKLRSGEIVAIYNDVTVRKRAELALQELNEELEQRVENRTTELTAANKELEAFSYSVSHDLRAPLRHITGFVNLLLKDQAAFLDEKGLRHLDIISESATRMGTLIDDLLAFSRAGRAELKKNRFALKPLVEKNVRDAAAAVPDRDIIWSVDDLPEVFGDRAMLDQVLTNLISNAVKFTAHRESARIEIGANTTQDGMPAIYVRDNGAGFDMRYAHKLFGVFQRLHTKEEFEGTGIGLANIRRIINRHGGRTWAEGEVNGGAAFYFTLPEASTDCAEKA